MINTNEYLINAAQAIKENCLQKHTVNKCECPFAKGDNGCYFTTSGTNPTNWDLPKFIKWSKEDVAFAKAYKMIGFEFINCSGQDMSVRVWNADGDYLVAPNRVFANVPYGENINLDDIIKEEEE